MVSPSVVLLDNHTTNRTRKFAESYGWKWENKSTGSDAWRGDYANYLKRDNYDIRTQLFYFLYGGWISIGSINSIGSSGYYRSSTVYDANSVYGLHFTLTNVYPSSHHWRSHGFSIRCLAR